MRTTKALRRLTPEEAQERDRLIGSILDGQTLNRNERRHIEGLSLPELRRFAELMKVADAARATSSSEADVEKAVGEVMATSVARPAGTVRK